MRRIAVVALGSAAALIVVAAASPASLAAGLEGASVVGLVNKQRAANGIPPITTVEQQDASSWCPREFEAPFTNGETGRVSASVNTWTPTTTPYSTAPLHQYVIYDPLATVAGDVSTPAGTDCMGVSEGAALLAPVTAPVPVFYAFVNERGPHFARSSEIARELPTTPQQQLGEPASERTGPQILLFAIGLGFSPHASAVTLTTHAGVPVAGTRVAAGSHGGVLVPPPLKPGTSYQLTIDWVGEPQSTIEGFGLATVPAKTATQTLSFATTPSLKPARRTRRHRR